MRINFLFRNCSAKTQVLYLNCFFLHKHKQYNFIFFKLFVVQRRQSKTIALELDKWHTPARIQLNRHKKIPIDFDQCCTMIELTTNKSIERQSIIGAAISFRIIFNQLFLPGSDQSMAKYFFKKLLCLNKNVYVINVFFL